MEIQTQNLVTISVDGDKLSSNFIAIDQQIKTILQELEQIKRAQTAFEYSVDNQYGLIRNITKQAEDHSRAIKKHATVIDQFGEEPGEGSEDEEHLENKSGIACSSNAEEEERQEIKQNATEADRQAPVLVDKPKPAKNGLEKIMCGFRERLNVLEKDSQEKDAMINGLNEIVDKFKGRGENYKRLSSDNVRKSFKKPQFGDKRPSFLIPELEAGNQDSLKTVPRSEVGEPSENIIPYDFSGSNTEDISKEMNLLKKSLLDKIQVIEAQHRESQHRSQAIQKTVDILERSHEMLKYNFDETSTGGGWATASTRPIRSQQKGRKDERLNDTRTTTRQLYEDKLVELFHDMEIIKKQYFQIQSKLARDDDDIPSNCNLLQIPGKDKEKHSKPIHTLKTEASEHRKQMAMVKRELTKLRDEFEDFAFGVNTGAGDTRTIVIKPNENKEDWKMLSTKIYKVKMEMQSGLREMEGKIAANNDMVVVLNNLEVGIEESKLLIKRKVDSSDHDKSMKRMQTKLNNFIMQFYEKENKDHQADAALGKQPWFCLSCDNQLKHYTAKMSKSPSKEKFMGRKVNPESHMVRRNENGRLPSVLK